MKKSEDLFSQDEGMTIDGSSIEERHEMWALLFEKNLIHNQCESLDTELMILNKQSFYFDVDSGKFLTEFISMPSKNIPFEEFKTRLSKL